MKGMTMTKTDPFEFLNPLDEQKYTLPPYDAEKFANEIADHADYIPKVSLTDALLADDPAEGMEALEEPERRLNILVTRSMVKTLHNHFETDDDPAWVALRNLIDAGEFTVLGKMFREWRKHYKAEGDQPGED